MTRLFKAVVLTAVLWLSAPVSAEPYKVQLLGDVNLFHPVSSESQFGAVATIEITLVFDRSIYPTLKTYGYGLADGLQRMEIKFFNASGEPVAGNALLPTLNDMSGSSNTYVTSQYMRTDYEVLAPLKQSVVELFVSGVNDFELFETLSEAGYRMATFENEGINLDGMLQVRPIIRNAYFDVHTLREIIQDADGDGIADADDQCATTIASDTVWFDGVNSGVTNHVDANGCAISDHYASCDAEQPSSSFFSYSGPTQCEMLMGYQLYREGLIDYTELRMLRNAL